MQATQPAQSLRYRSPGPHSSGAPKGGASHPPLCPKGQGGLYLWPQNTARSGLMTKSVTPVRRTVRLEFRDVEHRWYLW
jgi:hypothetical protein